MVVVVVNDLTVVLDELAHLLQVAALHLLEMPGGQGHLLLKVVSGDAVFVNLVLVVLLEAPKKVLH